MSVKHPSLNVIYVAALNGGLFVLDSASQVQFQYFNMTCKKVFLRNGQLYASMGKEGYSIFQMNPQNGFLTLVINNQIGSSVDSIYVDQTAQFIYIGSEGYIYLIQVSGQGQKQTDYAVSMHVGIYSGESNYIYSTQDEQYLMVANLGNGVSVINISQKNQPYLVSQKLPEWQVVDLKMVSKGQIVYAIEEWYGLFIGDFSSLYVNENIFKAKDQVWVNHLSFQATSRAIEVSSDEKFLFVGLRQIGVYIFDISSSQNKLNPILIQKVQISGLANHIFMYNSDNSFLYSNGCCVSITNKVEANFNTDIPNVFNTHISRSFQVLDVDTIPWDYKYSSNSQQLYLAAAFNGLQVFQLQNSTFLPPIKLFSSNSYPSTSTDTVTLIEEKNLLVQGSSEKGIILWDIKNLTSIKKVGEFNHPLQNSDSDGIVYNSKLGCLAIANGYQGAYLLDINDLNNLKMISEINVIDYDMQVTAESILMTQDANYLAISLRYYGVLIFNMKILKSPNLISNFITYGGEKCILSYDENYIFVSDGYKGITIINFVDKENAYIQSSLNLGAQALYAYQSKINQNIIYVSLIENGQLAVIDVSNKSNPYKMAQIQYGFEKSFALREAPNQQFITYLTSNGLRFQSISFPIKIHTQIRKIIQIQQNLQKTFIIVSSNEQFKVGETVELIFSSILFNQSIKLEKIFYYKEFQVTQIEQWMQFNQDKNKLRMTIDKNAIQNNNGLNIVLLQILIQLNQTSFISQTYSINQTQSSQIYQKLKQRAILNDNDYLNLNNFQLNSNFYIDLDNTPQYSNITATQDYIKQILLQSIYYQPIKFNVVSSLVLNLIYSENNQPISTISQTVKIIIQIFDAQSYFIENTVALQAQISMSQDFKSVVIEGQTIDVNQILLDGVEAVFYQQIDQILVQVTLIDNINFDVVQTYKVSQLQFLKNAKQINNYNSLKQQFEDQISEQLTVDKVYTFTFSSNTFQYLLPQQEGLQFQAFIKKDSNTYVNIQDIDWIDFDSSNRQFKWQGSLSQLSKRYTIVINATLTNSNKYWAEDSFEIHFERIPVELIVMICLISFFFALVILILYCYRAKIQYFRYFERYSYSSEPAIVNKNFYKIIMLIPNYLGEFHKLWQQFIKNEKKENKSVKLNFKKYLTPQSKEIDVQLLIDKLKSIYELNKHFYSKLKDQEFKVTNFRLSNLVRGAFSRQMLQEDLATLEVYQQLKAIAQKKGFRKDWYKYYTKIVYPEKINEKVPVLTIEESNSHTNVDSYNMSQLEQNFPIIIIDESKIIFTLEEANSNQMEKNNSYNHQLLFENIKSEGYGYVNKAIKRQEPSYGEAIHILHSNIKKIVAFKKRAEESRCICFPKIRQKFFLDFQEIQNVKNSNLPEWLKCEVTQSSIILSGKPSSQDVGDILIRVYDKNNYILNQFFINVRKMRKQTYVNPELEAYQISNRQQMPPLSQQLLVPQHSKLSNQFQGLVPNKVVSSVGGSGILNTNTYYQQSPHTVNTNSPLQLNQSSNQVIQAQGQKRILRNHSKKSSQRYSIKQYKQLLNGNGDLNMIRLKSDNQIKDNSIVTENHKKNSDDYIYRKNMQSPTYQDSPTLENIQIKQCNNQDKNGITNYSSSSQMLHLQAQENNDIRAIKEENLLKLKGDNNYDSLDPEQIFSKPMKHFMNNYNHHHPIDNETIQEELQTNQKDQNKSHSSFNFNQNSRYKFSTSNAQHQEDQSSISQYKSYQESYDFEKSLGLMSCEQIDVNSPKLTQFKPISIKQLNQIPSNENIA
ncbi:transmembrane protein, putative (macronuclear) [Tetrahymena thermophila SB210]|uniref:Transmembrane protein, putative n=1 Tax=Tetrahymena thermophila (strain SB210) TaxID=312017 RepID=Q237J6_TETTS|nr:transmembrane protein, putative [Tetrahymena thermophila SB210]EAR92745.2 transmembrane protein, putative [Tetrahymena thermophila SB210]|eukprot:XP_001012990.2 transmembrane protein, putative [Tetrahymena thermophila SB210]